MQRSQPARKYPLKSRVIAWAILALFFGGLGWMIFRIAHEGVTLALCAGILTAAIAGWRNYRDTANAKHR